MCGEDTSSRKQSLASAAISANGSRAISVGASLRATATATSTASHSSLRFDRLQCVVGLAEIDGDALERVGHAAVGLDFGFGLGVGIALAARGGFRLGELCRVLGERDRGAAWLAVGARGEVDVEQEFCRCAHLNTSALLRRGSWR